MQFKAWEGFNLGKWSEEVNVRDFIQNNYTPYEGDGAFLADATEATKKLWDEICALSKKERENGGVLDADTSVVFIRTLKKLSVYRRTSLSNARCSPSAA